MIAWSSVENRTNGIPVVERLQSGLDGLRHTKRKESIRMARVDDKAVIKEAIREVMSERAVTYANGAVQFANTITDSWSSVINAFDAFFLRNFIEDQPPEAAEPILNAR